MNGWCLGEMPVAIWEAAGYPTCASSAEKSRQPLIASAFPQVGDEQPLGVPGLWGRRRLFSGDDMGLICH